MSIKHLKPRSKEEINEIINKELHKDWRDYIYTKVNDELSTIIQKNKTTKKNNVLERLVRLSVSVRYIEDLYPIYEKNKKHWNRIGFKKDDFVLSDLYKKLLGYGRRRAFSHKKNAPAYEFMHSIQLMMKRYGDTDIPKLSEDAWQIGANYYFAVYAYKIRIVNSELNSLLNGEIPRI